MIMMRNLKYNTESFCDIWDEFDKFKSDYIEIMANLDANYELTEGNVQTIYYLLYSRYGNNPIANMDINQWKYKMFTIIFMYSQTWLKKLDIQKSLRGLTETELLTGATQIYNHAFNPSSEPSTETLEELEYINDQNTAKHKRAKLEAYSILWTLLHANATEEFLVKFKPCFKLVVKPEHPLIYVTDEEEEEYDD